MPSIGKFQPYHRELEMHILLITSNIGFEAIPSVISFGLCRVLRATPVEAALYIPEHSVCITNTAHATSPNLTVWCTVLHNHPSVVLETRVARGVTSRIVLEALIRNHQGHLWRIDLPHPFEKKLQGQTGAAVPASLRVRWSYIEGSEPKAVAVSASPARSD